jgi:prepilin-type N-terminal cleavage/methylation domain-containing protein
MKIHIRRGRAAFTLIELMAVITIIVILAGIVVGGLGYVNEKQAREKAKVQIGLLSKALEEYKLDMGTYPPTANKPGTFTSKATNTSAELYIALFYEGYDYAKQGSPAVWTKRVGTVDVPKATRIYLPELDPTNSKQGWVDPVTGTPPASTPIKDPWGNQYGYRTATDSDGTANADTQNPDFDLWSIGKDGKSAPDTAADKTNKDDIRNF